MCKDDMYQDEHKRCCGCKEGPQGVPGLQGPQGIQGLSGAQGIMGLQGLQGPQGLQGAPGKDCEASSSQDCCNFAYFSAYSILDQTLASLGSPKFEAMNVTSGALDFDMSSAATAGEIKFLKHGVYSLQWGVDAKLSPPYPAPVPAWSFALYRNNALLAGSTSGGFSISPDDLVIHNSACLIVELFAGDILKIVNTSSLSVNAVANVTGSLVPLSSARLNASLVKLLA